MKQMKQWIGVGLIAVGIGLAGCTINDNVIKIEEEKRQLELPAESIEALNIVTDSGNLIVKGDEKATVIHVDADIKSKNVKPEEIIITLEKDGNTATLRSEINTGIGINYVDMTLTVTVPAQLPIALTDGSGDIDMTNLAGKLTIEDDSGDIQLTNTNGEVEIRDQSGDIKIKDASALKLIEDDSGDIVMENTGGNVAIHDQSGDMYIRKHKGDVTISDESGDIVIDTVEGNVLIENDGSGDRFVQNIKGSYTSK
ncbi:DUF4097 family beta strand repeat-containing protein [Brevibacillus formosus]|uniref:DUF4097 family beta strand repeat-containing protein n=1 Tax=Brevibacillus TaxID=55080 RepID=UPI000D101670|nr:MULTISPECIES: DUF4097 family beta strand repeat-containing protein [Brevibacillus]MBG9941989.1 hypothetical protein [Brevibacillus formosus]MED1945004.1 DUF4097 family beta strand repeat-containing protein [Brevibacillus formosus]MED1996309.1 DUF4097 family beta strand repeat-containing protein [Brevibacillus formosus]MED2081278.1 DUF4097 family beta strand repeat-containing protein [Brevibacillus formosus]PSK19679.1 hypothetical protein C7R94_06095 [Brevibacillus sp. NRRL NRS-603]